MMDWEGIVSIYQKWEQRSAERFRLRQIRRQQKHTERSWRVSIGNSITAMMEDALAATGRPRPPAGGQ